LKFLSLIFFVLTNIGTHAIANGGSEKILVKKSLNQSIEVSSVEIKKLDDVYVIWAISNYSKPVRVGDFDGVASSRVRVQINDCKTLNGAITSNLGLFSTPNAIGSYLGDLDNGSPVFFKGGNNEYITKEFISKVCESIKEKQKNPLAFLTVGKKYSLSEFENSTKSDICKKANIFRGEEGVVFYILGYPYSEMYTNGAASFSGTKYTEDGRCLAYFSARGVINGNSISKTAYCVADGFEINSQKQIGLNIGIASCIK
jgi:hypothetical protein